MRVIKWTGGILLAAVGTYITGVFLALLPPPKDVALVLSTLFSTATPPKTIFCSTGEVDRATMPDPFDKGFPDRCPGWIHINDDGNCDYGRVVGYDANKLWCTLASADGSLTGPTLKADLDRGGPYPRECGWMESGGFPAFWRVIGDSHDVRAMNVVKPNRIEASTFRPNVPTGAK